MILGIALGLVRLEQSLLVNTSLKRMPKQDVAHESVVGVGPFDLAQSFVEDLFRLFKERLDLFDQFFFVAVLFFRGFESLDVSMVARSTSVCVCWRCFVWSHLRIMLQLGAVRLMSQLAWLR